MISQELTLGLASDLIEKYLRPSDLANKYESNWQEENKVWIPHSEHGYIMGTVKSKDGNVINVELEDKTLCTVESHLIMKCEAYRNDRCEDMAAMNELNEPNVLNNLKRRFFSNLCQTYSGLFLVTINPYRNFPIYTPSVAEWYKNTLRTDRPPHIFAVADVAFRSMLETRQNQSILITGESGAGKTENTKRVIQYLTMITRNPQTSTNIQTDHISLEQQILCANPILESFGNAQTIRNNNSSRFGKFVKIEFSANGQITGANIERYLLEKSRVTHRNSVERSFHIFYQFLAGASNELKKKLHISGGAMDYALTRNSNSTLESVDDAKEFENLIKCMKVLGIQTKEQEEYFKVIAIVLLLGNLEFEENPETGQTTITNTDAAQNLCQLLSVSIKSFQLALLNPIIRAGLDVVSQIPNKEQVQHSVEALARAIYERMFSQLVKRINQSIDRASTGKSYFIGILDIAGFEIFQKNSFEQLCINYTNEKLQQFFNHHMFIVEQEEYRREGIEWNFIDFGLDLQPTIDLIEKSNPIGLLACLDEDCVMPKSTDKSFCEKLRNIWKAKSSKFEPTRFNDGFCLQHYAGKVEYSTEGWLEKNKDPLNENVTRLLAHSDKNALISVLFQDYVGTDEEIYQAGRGLKRGIFRTVAQKHKESLHLLMQTLHSTKPHFVRCIIPNNCKAPEKLDSLMVLDQLRCNGVLEGIRICRLGYPNRISFSEFCRLYEIILPTKQTLPTENRDACKRILELIGCQEGESFKLGHTKVFFKSGELSKLDERRDTRLGEILKTFQAYCRGALARQSKIQMKRQQEAALILQRNVQIYLKLRDWSWWKLYLRIKPLLNVTRAENRIEELEYEIERIQEERDMMNAELQKALDTEQVKVFELEAKRRELERMNQKYELQLIEANEIKSALIERQQMQELELSHYKEKLSVEIEAQKQAMQLKLALQQQEQINLQKTIEELRGALQTSKQAYDDLEFERLKAEKGEMMARQKITEMEAQLDEAKRNRKDLEVRLQQAEDVRRALQEQLDDESREQASKRQATSEYEAQLKVLRQQQEQAQQVARDDMTNMQRRYEREIKQLQFDLEQEQKQVAQLKETLKRYESGTDDLTNQLQAEMKQQMSWKRESEKLEAKVAELKRQCQEALDREDSLEAQLSQSYEQYREQRIRAEDLAEELATAERNKKQLEARLEAGAEQLRETSLAKQSLERQMAQMMMRTAELEERLTSEQEGSAVFAERLAGSEQKTRAVMTELEVERRQSERLKRECEVLEEQIKEMQLLSLAKPNNNNSINTSLSTILERIDQESGERQALVVEKVRLERALHDLNLQVAEQGRTRVVQEEQMAKLQLRLNQMQSRLDEMTRSLRDCESNKRRTERDLVDERENNARLARELERLKGRIERRLL